MAAEMMAGTQQQAAHVDDDGPHEHAPPEDRGDGDKSPGVDPTTPPAQVLAPQGLLCQAEGALLLIATCD